MAFKITRLKLENWKNFEGVDLKFSDRVFIAGPNASGKSNLLEAILFLKRLTDDDGGLQAAVREQGGMPKLRCLWARGKNDVLIEVEVEDQGENQEWKFHLKFGTLGSTEKDFDEKVRIKPRVLREIISVRRKIEGKMKWDDIVNEGWEKEEKDPKKLVKTGATVIETVNHEKTNEVNRLREFFRDIDFIHPVPKVVRELTSDEKNRDSVGKFGEGLIEALNGGEIEDEEGHENETNEEKEERETRKQVAIEREEKATQILKKIESMLRGAIPNLVSLEAERRDGKPHLVGKFKNWRFPKAKHDERWLSDGTLRLVGILWMLLSKDNGVLLLDEPENSLHAGIVKHLPQLIWKAQQTSKTQVFVTTHSDVLLDSESVDPEEVILLLPKNEGAVEAISMPTHEEATTLLSAGFDLAEVVQMMTAPPKLPLVFDEIEDE